MKKQFLFLLSFLAVSIIAYAQNENDPEALATLDKVKFLPADNAPAEFSKMGIIEPSFAINKKQSQFMLALNGQCVTQPVPPGLPKGDITVEQQVFGTQGRTIVFYGKTKIAEGPVIGFSYSFSGKNIKLHHSKEKDADVYTVYNGTMDQKHCGAQLTYLKSSNAWVLDCMNNSGITTVSDIYRGMSLQNLKDVLRDLGTFTFTSKKEGTYTVYELLLPSMSKATKKWSNDYYYVAGMKGYGKFYFDSKGRLIKWLISSKK